MSGFIFLRGLYLELFEEDLVQTTMPHVDSFTDVSCRTGNLEFACFHCHQNTKSPLFESEHSELKGKPFCCVGCLTVAKILCVKGLSDYYSLRESSGWMPRRSPAMFREKNYSYMDTQNFLNDYVVKTETGRKIQFYLEGIHCLACLWVIEKLPEIIPGLKSSYLNLEKNVATFDLIESLKISSLADELEHLGYRPHPLKNSLESENKKKEAERWDLLRIGLAAAGANNVMIYAISNYVGAEGSLKNIFEFLTILFALPVLLFSAFPFYRNAYYSLKSRQLSIDFPIALSLVLGTSMGVYQWFYHTGDNYFDSLTSLVFLLLLSRYFLKRIQEQALATRDIHYSFTQDSFKKMNDTKSSSFEVVSYSDIQKGDLILVEAEDGIAFDGVVVKGAPTLNLALLTGESQPVRVADGQTVWAGTQNREDSFIMKVTAMGEESRLGHILKMVEQGQNKRAPIVDDLQKVSKWFLLVLITLSGIFLLYFSLNENIFLGLEKMITLLIVTCPCALAIGAPLVFMTALEQAQQEGIVVKGEEVLQRLESVKSIVFDKTGTLTKLESKVRLPPYFFEQNVEELVCWYALFEKSKHPQALVLKKTFLDLLSERKYVLPATQSLYKYKEILGEGLECEFEGNLWSYKKNVFKKGESVIGEVTFSEVLQPGVEKMLWTLKKRGYQLYLFSGDKQISVEKISQRFPTLFTKAIGELSPERKKKLIKELDHPLMIGDGANDAAAFTHAYVGLAVNGSVEMSLRAADIYLLRTDLSLIPRLLKHAQRSLQLLRQNVVISLSYNLVSVTAVALGWISPIFAAILMPLSSLSVVGSTYIGKYLRRDIWK
jgi:cation transport ATPase